MLAQHGRMRLLLNALNKELEIIRTRISYLNALKNNWQEYRMFYYY